MESAKLLWSALTSTLAAELAATSVIVNAVCPGLTATYPGAEGMGARPVAQAQLGSCGGHAARRRPRGGFFRDG
jgi:NAD(P)-dependent dehydrogenase (short-subunit alcohol dehydrogenase family)